LGFLSDLFAGRSLESMLERARRLLATGEFDEALAVVAKGLEKVPDALVLRETGQAIRRAKGRSGMSSLLTRIDADGDPVAFEELIALYRETGMVAEQVRLTDRFVVEHPDRELPHLLRGEQGLEDFFADLRARDGRLAIDHLLKAGALHPDSLKPRLLLAEIYYAIGADRALLGQAAAIERLAGDDEVVRPVVAALREAAQPAATEAIDALLAKVEVSGAVVRDPSTWSSRRRKGIAGEADGARVKRSLERLVRDDGAQEAVVIDRAGATLATVDERSLATAGPEAPSDEATEAPEATGLAGVARVVARTIKVQARELEMGAFRRCVVEGPFGVMVVADAAGGVVAARGRRGTDPHRLAERLAVAVEGGRGRRA
jgi:hypothetical protein